MILGDRTSMAVFIVMPATRDDTATDEKDDHYDQASEEREFVHGANRVRGLAGPRVICHYMHADTFFTRSPKEGVIV